MNKENELALKVTKEIIVKFIEVGRLSVSSFEESWNLVHRAIRASLNPSLSDLVEEDEEK